MMPAMTDTPPTAKDEPLVEIDRAALERLLFDPDVTVVDALPREAYRAGHIPGTYSLPVAEIHARALRELPVSQFAANSRQPDQLSQQHRGIATVS